MRYAAIALLVATGLACAQIQPGTAAYDAVTSIANNRYLNAVNVDCSDYRDAMCFETDVTDQAFARQLVDQAMEGNQAIEFWTKDSSGVQEKMWALSDTSVLLVKILPQSKAFLVIAYSGPISGAVGSGTSAASPKSPVEDPALQQLADEAGSKVQHYIYVSQFDCGDTPNTVCYDSTASTKEVKQAITKAFTLPDATWATPQAGVYTCEFSYKGAKLVVAIEPDDALPSRLLIAAASGE